MVSDSENRSLAIPDTAVPALPENFADTTIAQVYQIADLLTLVDAKNKLAALKRYVQRKQDKDEVAKVEIETRAHIGDLLGPNPGQGVNAAPGGFAVSSADDTGLSNNEAYEFRLLAEERNHYRRMLRDGELRYRHIIQSIQRKRRTKDVELGDLTDQYESVVSDVAELDVGPVDVIVTDPPYPKDYLWTFEALSETAARILKPGGLCVVMSGQSYLPQVVEALGAHLDYYWTGAYMLPGQPTPLRHRNVNCSWKPLLIYSNGAASPRIFGDVMESKQNEKDWHVWGQSESGMADVISRLTEPDHVICDPFVGGGATAIAALSLQRRIVVSDVDPDQVKLTDNRVSEWWSEQS